MQEYVVLLAKGDQSQVGGLQKRDRFLMCVASSVICLPLVIYQIKATAHVKQHATALFEATTFRLKGLRIRRIPTVIV